MRITLVALTSLAFLGSCSKRDPLFCGKHYPSDPTCGDAGVANGDGGAVSIGGTVVGLGNSTGLVLQNNGGVDVPIVKDGTFVFSMQIPVGAAYDVTVGAPPSGPSETCTVMNGSGTAVTDVNNVQVVCELASYNIGGAVFGLNAGTSVTLGNSNGDSVNVPSTMTNFTFPMKMVSGSPFNVSVTGQPASGGPCVPFGGMGTVGNGDVTTIVVNCSSSGPYAIGGTVAGLNGTVVLQNTGTPSDMVSINSNGTYSFPKLVPSGNQYNVSVQTQPSYPPASQTCSVTNGGPFTANGNVQNVNVLCSTNSFTVGGMITGVQGTVTLQNNGGNAINQTNNGSFTFSTALLSGASYNVTATPQSSTISCLVSNGSGRVANGNVTNVMITCSPVDQGIMCGGVYCALNKVCCDPAGSPSCQSSCSSTKLSCDDTADCSSGKYCCENTNSGHTQFNSASCQQTSSCGANFYLCDPNLDPTVACMGVGGTCSAWKSGYYACQ